MIVYLDIDVDELLELIDKFNGCGRFMDCRECDGDCERCFEEVEKYETQNETE